MAPTDTDGFSRAEWYQERIKDYIERESLVRAVSCRTVEAFEKETQDWPGSRLVITDAVTSTTHTTALETVSMVGKVGRIAIEYVESNFLPEEPPLPSAIMFVRPKDIDSWLLLMNRLLSLDS